MAAEPMTIDRQRFKKLCQAHAELQDEFTALLRCLEKNGTVSKASLHREIFQATLKRHPLPDCEPPSTLADVLEPQLLQGVLRSCGGVELLALKEACSATCRRSEAVQTGRLYAFGGTDSTWGKALKAVECFDLRTGKWESMPSMYVGRVASVAGVIGGHVYVCGGFSVLGKIVEKFNFRLQKWDRCVPVPKLSVQRAFAAAAVVHGRLYICGGEDVDASVVHKSVECFDPQLAGGKGGTEVLPAQMLAARRYHAAVALPGSLHVLVCGGRPYGMSSDVSVNAVHIHGTTEMLDVVHTGSSWQEQAPMIRPRVGHSALCIRGSIYVCGGYHDDNPDPVSTVERFDLEQGCWNSMPPMLINRGAHGAATLAHRLYVVGGARHFWPPGTSGLESAECFDQDAGKWEWIPQMLQTRMQFPMVTVKLGGFFG